MALAPEPVGSQALGSYTYVSNSPMDSVDPSGMWGFNIGFGGFTWGPGGASGWGYVGGGSWAGPSGWPGSGLSLGSLFGFSLSFSIGGSSSGAGQRLTGLDIAYAQAFGGAGSQPPSAEPGRGFAGVGAGSAFRMPTFDEGLKGLSDFSAGFGDALTGRMLPFVHTSLTEMVRQRHGIDSVVSKDGIVYNAGEVAGGTVGWTLAAAEGATTAAIAGGKSGSWFGRGTNTLFNSSRVRFGWGWVGSATTGRDVIRLGVGAARGTNWWSHIILYYPRFGI